LAGSADIETATYGFQCDVISFYNSLLTIISKTHCKLDESEIDVRATIPISGFEPEFVFSNKYDVIYFYNSN